MQSARFHLWSRFPANLRRWHRLSCRPWRRCRRCHCCDCLWWPSMACFRKSKEVIISGMVSKTNDLNLTFPIMSKLYLWMGQKIGETEYKRNAGGDMSFLICGLWPGWSFCPILVAKYQNWSFAQFWWQNTKIGVLPNSDDKMPDFQGHAWVLRVSKKFSHSFETYFWTSVEIEVL